MSVFITTYYADPQQRRRDELEFCLQMNEGVFDEIIVLSENAPPTYDTRATWIEVNYRPKFQDVFSLTSKIKKKEVVVIANCDMVIPLHAVWIMEDHLKQNQVYCLTRWEMDKGIYLRDIFYSQDVWCFRGPIQNVPGDFYFGVPGCDNHVSCGFADAGYEVSNPSKTIKTFHIHSSGVRTSTNKEHCRVPPPYLYITPHELGDRAITTRVETLEQRRKEFRKRRKRT